jgi:ATP-dependent RNA helicase RhlE
MAFSKLGLSQAMLQGVKAMGYVEPTPIQLRTIPLILAGCDVIGSAQTVPARPRRLPCRF